jgi:hypothetical protein
MPAARTSTVLVAALVLMGSCGDDDDTTSTTARAATTTSASAGTTTTAAASTTTTTAGAERGQPAIWPAADVVFTTPEAAAADFVTEVLRVPPVLGEFQQGDARSGEIEVFSPGEGDAATRVPRGLLFVRQLGPDDGWFVLAAANDNATVTTPEPMAEVVAGPLTVEGTARGFEANVVVTAFVAGDVDAQLDQAITQGGALDLPEPFTVSIDLSGAAPGDVVTLLVRGGAGLETDPGDFGAIPVVIAG